MHSVLRSWNINEEDFYKTESVEDKVRHILRYGQLAPSTHNTQPWRISIKGDTCVIRIDSSLKLSQADPIERNLYISIGCFITNTLVAAEYYGVSTSIVFSEDEDNNIVSTIKFENISAPQKHKFIFKLKSLETIKKRATYRGVFEARSIPSGVIDRLSSLSTADISILTFSSRSEISKLAEITGASVKRVANNQNFREELSRWMRPSNTKKYDGIPGYAYGFSYLVSLVAPYLMSVLNPSSTMASKSKSTAKSAALATVIVSKINSKILWIKTGMISERVILILQENNIRTSINVASIQDDDGLKQLCRLIPKKYIPQFVMFSGYTDSFSIPTPRYEIERKMEL